MPTRTELLYVEAKKLKFMDGNRLINDKHLNELVISIRTKNLLDLCPLKINRHYEVIDGQHRLAAALQLGIAEVPCIVCSEATLDDAKIMNQHTKNWNAQDFAFAFARQGHQDYDIFCQFMKATGVRVDVAIRLLTGSDTLSFKSFKNGDFKVKSLDQAWRIHDELKRFEPFFADDTWKSRSFVGAYLQLRSTKGYEHDRMIAKCSLMRPTRRMKVVEYVEMLEEIYNYAARGATRLRFTKV